MELNTSLEDTTQFDTVQFRYSAISTKRRNFDTETLQKTSHFDTSLDVSTHFLRNVYLCSFIGFHSMDFVLVYLKSINLSNLHKLAKKALICM